MTSKKLPGKGKGTHKGHGSANPAFSGGGKAPQPTKKASMKASQKKLSN